MPPSLCTWPEPSESELWGALRGKERCFVTAARYVRRLLVLAHSEEASEEAWGIDMACDDCQ